MVGWNDRAVSHEAELVGLTAEVVRAVSRSFAEVRAWRTRRHPQWMAHLRMRIAMDLVLLAREPLVVRAVMVLVVGEELDRACGRP